MSSQITPFPPLNDDGRTPDNGFTQIENGGQFPSAAPIWGFGQSVKITELTTPSYNDSEQSGIFTVVPDDAADLPSPISRFYVGTAGDVHFATDLGQEITLKHLAAGVDHKFPFMIVRIFSTGTTAADIVGIS